MAKLFPCGKYTQKPSAEQILFALPRRNSICGHEVAKYTQKPSAEQILFALPRRNSICGRQAKYTKTRPHTDEIRRNNASSWK